MAEQTGGGILVISEGVFGMRGEQGKLREIVALKKKFNLGVSRGAFPCWQSPPPIARGS
jgi:hypothetical protein